MYSVWSSTVHPKFPCVTWNSHLRLSNRYPCNYKIQQAYILLGWEKTSVLKLNVHVLCYHGKPCDLDSASKWTLTVLHSSWDNSVLGCWSVQFKHVTSQQFIFFVMFQSCFFYWKYNHLKEQTKKCFLNFLNCISVLVFFLRAIVKILTSLLMQSLSVI